MIWVSSSAALAAVCALSLFWAVPHLQRRRETPVEAQVEIDGTDLAPELSPAPAVTASPVSRRGRTTMATTDTSSRRAGSRAASRAGTVRLKRDRVGIFLAGCAALAAALVTAVVAPFSAAVGWPWPVFLLLFGGGCVLALRYLAVQERTARRVAHSRDPQTGDATEPQAADPHAPREDVALFDNEHGAAACTDAPASVGDLGLDLPAEHEQPRTPVAFTVEELRAEALRVARESAGAQRTWEPVPVPRPSYAEAAVVPRPEPEPLSPPEQPVARSTTLKDAVRTGEEHGRAALDLDDVLKRRRA